MCRHVRYSINVSFFITKRAGLSSKKGGGNPARAAAIRARPENRPLPTPWEWVYSKRKKRMAAHACLRLGESDVLSARLHGYKSKNPLGGKRYPHPHSAADGCRKARRQRAGHSVDSRRGVCHRHGRHGVHVPRTKSGQKIRRGRHFPRVPSFR